MAAKKKTPTKKSHKTEAPAPVRQLKREPYKSFRLSKKLKHERPQLKGSHKIFRASLRHLRQNWRVFGVIVLVYFVLTIVMVKGFGIASGVEDLKLAFEEVFKGFWGEVASGLTLFTLLVTASGSTASPETSVYQSIFLVVVSLALIWALRQTHAKQKIKAKEAFYKGMYPLVPFMLVIAVITLQILPIFFASWLYSAVLVDQLAITVIEQALWWILIALLVLGSLYMLTSSLFALYIVTLPDMTPMKALRSARELVRHRRMLVARRLLAMPIFLLLTAIIIMVPIIVWVTPAAEWTFFVLNMTLLALVHSYMYSLYRELL